MQWDLSKLYKGFDDLEFLKEYEIYGVKTLELVAWSKQLQDPQLQQLTFVESFLVQMIELKLIGSKLNQFASLTLATNADHGEAQSYIEKVGKFSKQQTEPVVRFQRWLFSLSVEALEAMAESSSIIKEHLFYLLNLRSDAEHLLELESEVVMARLKGNGSEAWSQLQAQLTANMVIPVSIANQPESMPLQSLRNLAFSGDANTRREAFAAELGAYPTIAPVSAAALNAIKGEVIIESELRGFKSPLDRTLYDAKMTKKTLDAMIEAVVLFLPTLRNYQKKKAQLLGHGDGLPFYDIHAPLQTLSKQYSFEEAKTMVLSAFSSFSDDLHDFAKDAFEGNWIDVAPKKGKRAGAFCSGIRGIKQSRVLLNFTGSLNNVITLAHELGHGYHGRQIFNQSPLNGSYSMPVAETASIFCETIFKQQLISGAADSEALGILDASIQGYAQTIMDIYSRYIFETSVFERRIDSSIGVEELNNLMIEAQKAAYGDALNPQTYHPYMWVNKVHYYYPQRNFYNFPYTFGLLFAKGLYAIYLEKGEAFIPEYRHMLEMTGQNSVEETALLLNIDIQKRDFWERALGVIQEEIDMFNICADKVLSR